MTIKNIFWHSILLFGVLSIFVQSASAITSDDFNASILNSSLWTIVDPRNDATITNVGSGTPDALLNITVPAGRNHDVWITNDAARIMQSATDTDFEIEVKFQSQLTQGYQMQGIIIEQDSSNYLRFDFYSDGSNTRIFAADFISGSPVVKIKDKIGGIPSAVPLYMRVKRQGNQWTQSYSTNGISWTPAVSFSRVLTVNKVGPFGGNYENPENTAPGFTSLIDYFFNTASPAVPEDEGDNIAPNITIWYGNHQRFGQIGIPQRCVNILGNAYDSSGISLTYSLNGGISHPLTVGPDGMRLQSNGDFNIEIDHNELACGNNKVVITVDDYAGNTKSETVWFVYACDTVWPGTYSINWSDVTSIQDAAQIVDGLWVKEPTSIRPGISGYDRLVAIGDITWDDYEVTIPITINTPLDSSTPEGGPLIGIIMRWQGHNDRDSKQPRNGWVPLGAVGGYDWVSMEKVYRLRIFGNDMQSIAEDGSGRQLSVGVPYIFKMRAETIGEKTLYSLKVWEKTSTEPSDWTASGYGVPGGLKQGSLLLLSHHTNVSFGNVTIKPGPFSSSYLPGIWQASISRNLMIGNLLFNKARHLIWVRNDHYERLSRTDGIGLRLLKVIGY